MGLFKIQAYEMHLFDTHRQDCQQAKQNTFVVAPVLQAVNL